MTIDLGRHFDRLGLEPAHHEERERLERLQRHAAGLERALERFPHARLDDRVVEVEEQKAAVRLDQRAADDAGEVGRAAAGRIDPAFDGAEQVAIGRRVLGDHRRAAAPGVIDYHVDLVLEEPALLGAVGALRHRRTRRAIGPCLRSLAEAIETVEHVLGNLVEVGRYGRALEARLERGDGGCDEARGEGAFDLADLLDQLAHQLLLMHRHGREQVGELALLLAQPFALLPREAPASCD